MELQDLYRHALTILPEAASDLVRAGRDPGDFVFASFDGSSDLGVAFIATDFAEELGVDPMCARAEVERMIASTRGRGEDLVVSLMVAKDVLALLLSASRVDPNTRAAVRLWLDGPLSYGHFRVVAIAGEHVHAASVAYEDERERSPASLQAMN